MSIFDRKRPLKTLKRYFGRFFQKKHSENIEFVNTTIPPVVIPDGLGELADTPGNGEPGDTVPDGMIPVAISDTDGDTVVNTEESADEDAIRFDTSGKERFRMGGNDTNGGALYIKEGSGTTAPATPTSGEGVFYEKNDGKIYFKNDGGTEYDLTVSGGGGSMSSFDITGDSGSAQTVTDGNTVDIEGGTGINTVAGATDKVTVNCDLEGTELKSTGETGATKFLREDGDGTCSWQSVTTTPRVIVSHTYAIGGEVSVASGDTDFIIPMTVRNTYTSAGYSTTVKLKSVIYSINSGTNVTWKLQKNGSDISGYGTTGSPLTAATTPATTEASETLSDKDELAPVVVAVSGTPRNMSITIFLEITAA
jgi:hypothetical protein